MTPRSLGIIMVALPLIFAAANVALFFLAGNEHGLIWAAILIQSSQQMATAFRRRIWPQDK